VSGTCTHFEVYREMQDRRFRSFPPASLAYWPMFLYSGSHVIFDNKVLRYVMTFRPQVNARRSAFLLSRRKTIYLLTSQMLWPL